VIILALDTTSEFGSLAIRAGDALVAEFTLCSSEGFAHLVFSAIDELLAQAGLRLNQIDCFAAASGPGAFTGVRVGLSAVKGLADAMGRPACGISNLRAVASFGRSDHRAVLLDARRGELFGAVYNAGLDLIVPETVQPLNSWLDSLPLAEYEFITRRAESFRLAGTRFADMPFVEAPRNLAPAIAFCAQMDGRLGRWSDPAALDANYVRRSDAELFWKDG
jgi:tRNA threonylcarbamoyladenosine biosynthesis protein TsaB